MTTLQEIADLADAMQLRGDERKVFIAEEIDKLRKLQAEERATEGEARLQAEEREREARLQAEENERQARLKTEELRAQVEIEKIRARVGVKTIDGAAERTTDIYADQVKPKLPRGVWMDR